MIPPQDTSLGPLELEAVFFRVEVPVIFTALTPSHTRYFVVGVDDDEEAESMTYLYVAVSPRRWSAMRSGVLPLRDAFTQPEDGRVCVVSTDYSGTEPESAARWLGPQDVPELYLPTDRALLQLPTRSAETFDEGELALDARAQARSAMALRLEPPQLTRTEFPVRPLARVLRFAQETIESLVAEGDGRRPGIVGPLPTQAVEDAELVVTALRAASFVIVLAPNRSTRLVEVPETTNALGRFLELVNACTEVEDLRTFSSDLSARTLGKFRDLLHEVADGESPMTVYLADTRGGTRRASIGVDDAQSSIRVLDEVNSDVEEFEVARAILVGVNLRTGVFELSVEDHEPDKVTGKIDPTASSAIEGLPTGEAYAYRARLIRETSYSTLTSEVKTKYRLLDIWRPDE